MPAGKTYIKIASQSASSSSSITFSNIPQNYTDLIMVINAQAGTSGEDFLMRFNGDTGNNYSNIWLRGLIAGTTSGQQEQTTSRIRLSDGGSSTTSNMSLINVNIQKYSAGIVKQVMSRANNAPRGLDMFGSRWNSTSAITSITILMSAGVISSGTFTLYGIECAKSPKATGGNIIRTDGTYWYHAFTTSGLFAPTQSLTADVLVVAGGGGGGGLGGSGGGGGVITPTSLSFAPNAYTFTIGSGGSGVAANDLSTNGGRGGDTTVYYNGGSLVAYGGGGGVAYSPPSDPSSKNGGSGGGGGGSTSQYAGGTGVAGQGNAGGNSLNNADIRGGGGGGYSAAGGNAVSNAGGNGGQGYNLSSSFQFPIPGNTHVGSGAGGPCRQSVGTNGTSGTGAGVPTNNNTNASNPTMFGCAGAATCQTAGSQPFGAASAGYSGIVIVRYPV